VIWLNRVFELPLEPLLASLAAIVAILWVRGETDRVLARASALASPSWVRGGDAAAEMLRLTELDAARIERVGGQLVDFYDPGTATIRLSEGVYDGTTIAALGRAAHEVGHAHQDARRDAPMPLAVRRALAFLARLGAPTAALVVACGFVFDIRSLLVLGLWILPATAAVTAALSRRLERDASHRGLRALAMLGLLDSSHDAPLRAVLAAAGWDDFTHSLPRVRPPAWQRSRSSHPLWPSPRTHHVEP
jgi:Zn-dependent membrane protease YugP